jgi:hypothetical protein
MAVLKINGWEIPLDANVDAEMTETIVGERKEAFDGTLLTSINNNRRTLVLNTPLIEKEDADALVGIVQGLGENFSLSNTLYSGKGYEATFTRDSTRYLIDATSISSGTAGYEDSLYVTTISTDLRAVWIETGTANLLRTNQATASSSSGFEPWGSGDLTFTTSGVPREGDRCLYLTITSSGLYHGMRVNNSTQDGGDYTFSLWAKGESGSVGNVFLSIYDGVTITDSDIFVLTEDWVRYEITATCTSGTIYGYFRNSTTGLVAAYCDQLQLE